MLVRSNSRLYVIDVFNNPCVEELFTGEDLTNDYIAGCLARCRADAGCNKTFY
jgi:hypothetical protein